MNLFEFVGGGADCRGFWMVEDKEMVSTRRRRISRPDQIILFLRLKGTSLAGPWRPFKKEASLLTAPYLMPPYGEAIGVPREHTRRCWFHNLSMMYGCR